MALFNQASRVIMKGRTHSACRKVPYVYGVSLDELRPPLFPITPMLHTVMNRDYEDEIIQPRCVSFSAILLYILMMLIVYILAQDTITRLL